MKRRGSRETSRTTGCGTRNGSTRGSSVTPATHVRQETLETVLNSRTPILSTDGRVVPHPPPGCPGRVTVGPGEGHEDYRIPAPLTPAPTEPSSYRVLEVLSVSTRTSVGLRSVDTLGWRSRVGVRDTRGYSRPSRGLFPLLRSERPVSPESMWGPVTVVPGTRRRQDVPT